jgi:hypothetical protein
MKLDPITPDEKCCLMMMPFLAAEIILGKPSGTIEERSEGRRFVWHMTFSEVQTMARKAAADSLQSTFFLSFGLKDPFQVLGEAAAILKRKASPEKAAKLKNAVILICTNNRPAGVAPRPGSSCSNPAQAAALRDAMDRIAAAMHTSIDWSRDVPF